MWRWTPIPESGLIVTSSASHHCFPAIDPFSHWYHRSEPWWTWAMRMSVNCWNSSLRIHSSQEMPKSQPKWRRFRKNVSSSSSRIIHLPSWFPTSMVTCPPRILRHWSYPRVFPVLIVKGQELTAVIPTMVNSSLKLVLNVPNPIAGHLEWKVWMPVTCVI